MGGVGGTGDSDVGLDNWEDGKILLQDGEDQWKSRFGERTFHSLSVCLSLLVIATTYISA